MSLLGGDLAGVFASAFSGLYLDGTLHRKATTGDGKGGGTVSYVDEAVKAQPDKTTEAMRSEDGYTETDIRILVLAAGVLPITSNDEITMLGQRWLISTPIKDPAGAAYELHGRKA